MPPIFLQKRVPLVFLSLSPLTCLFLLWKQTRPNYDTYRLCGKKTKFYRVAVDVRWDKGLHVHALSYVPAQRKQSTGVSVPPSTLRQSASRWIGLGHICWTISSRIQVSISMLTETTQDLYSLTWPLLSVLTPFFDQLWTRAGTTMPLKVKLSSLTHLLFIPFLHTPLFNGTAPFSSMQVHSLEPSCMPPSLSSTTSNQRTNMVNYTYPSFSPSPIS